MLRLKYRSPLSVAFFSLSYICFNPIADATDIIAYSDSACAVPIFKLSGPNNGVCQQSLQGATSFQVSSVDSGCVVTMYAADAPFCDTNDRFPAVPRRCYSDPSITQFSIDDCQMQVNDESTSTISSSQGSGIPSSTTIPAVAVTVVTSNQASLITSSTSSSSQDRPSSSSSQDSNSISATSQATQPNVKTTAVTTTSTSTQAPSPTNSGLSTSGQIAIGTVLPGLAVLVAVIFGVQQWNRRKMAG